MFGGNITLCCHCPTAICCHCHAPPPSAPAGTPPPARFSLSPSAPPLGPAHHPTKPSWPLGPLSHSLSRRLTASDPPTSPLHALYQPLRLPSDPLSPSLANLPTCCRCPLSPLPHEHRVSQVRPQTPPLPLPLPRCLTTLDPLLSYFSLAHTIDMPALSLADEKVIFTVSCAHLHPPALACTLLHSCTLHAPQSAFPRFATFPCCECSALLPVLGHPCVCPLAPSLANAP